MQRFYKNNQNNKIGVPTRDGMSFIEIESIVYCKADGAYTVIILLNQTSLLISRTLKVFQRKLDSTLFQRPHRSYLVNINMIEKYIRGSGGCIVLKDKTIIPVSRRRKRRFLKGIS